MRFRAEITFEAATAEEAESKLLKLSDVVLILDGPEEIDDDPLEAEEEDDEEENDETVL